MGLCAAAVDQVNRAGGVLNHQLKCAPFDSTSDPADALPVANRMLASTSNLVMVYGPATAGLEPVVEPLLNNAKVVHFSDASDPRNDHQTSPYFWQIAPSDSLQGVALADYAFRRGYRNVAVVSTTDSSSQSILPPLTQTLGKLGMHTALQLNLDPSQASYRTEVARVLAAKPDAIVGEMEPQAAATFFSEMLQLNNGKLPPVLQAGTATTPSWYNPVKGAVGSAALDKYFISVNSNIPSSGPGYATFKHAILTAPKVPGPRTGGQSAYFGNPYSQWYYDGFILGALAMTQAKSTDASKWSPLIRDIANGKPGAVTVSSYAAGVKALGQGKAIHYVGASGPLFFNSNSLNAVPFVGFGWSGTNLHPVPPTLTPSQLARLG
jgi:branched-chain amino acid transport system substrate-binding protein